MRHSLDRCRVPSLVAALIAALALPACTVEAGDDAAHAIADKFAEESAPEQHEEQELATSPQPVATEMLTTGSTKREDEQAETMRLAEAKAEAERSAEAKRLAAEKAEAQRIAEAKRLAAEKAKAERIAEAKRVAAEKSEAERRAKAEREADEADMLARARAEAEERRQEKLKRLLEIERAAAEEERQRTAKAAEEERRRIAEEEQRKAAEARRIAEDRQRIEEEQRRAAEAKRLAEIAAQEATRKAAEERRMAEERRRLAEEEQRRVAVARRLEEQRQLAEQERRRLAEIETMNRARAEAEARRIAAERQLEEEGRRRAEQTRALTVYANSEEPRRRSYQEIERARESQRLAEKLKLIRDSRAERDSEIPSPYGLGAPMPTDPFDAAHAVIRTRVTVLLVMQPGSRGIRRFEKSADPILCMSSRCYVSRGAAAPAEAISRGKAFGPTVALVSRAGRCRHSLTCVFRNVDLERTMAEVQPIDLRILRHDRRERRTVMPDPTCQLEDGHLSCRRPVIAPDYTMWVVPENVAEKVGSLALEMAVRAGLPSHRGLASTGNN